MNRIIRLSELDESLKKKAIEEIQEIFFLSTSVKSFTSDDHKKLFFEKWCGDYIVHFPETFYLFFDEDDSLLGYLSGCNDTLSSFSFMRVPAQTLFSEQLESFPAHLHINFHPKARGMGLGSHLIEFYARELVMCNIPGLHLVTSPDARNVSFYDRLGFDHHVVKEINGSKLLFMGKKLTTSL